MLLGVRNAMGMKDTPSLPYDYEVEYLQSDGTAYVDTGIVARPSLVDFLFTLSIKLSYPNGGTNLRGCVSFGPTARAFASVGIDSDKFYIRYHLSSASISLDDPTCDTPTVIKMEHSSVGPASMYANGVLVNKVTATNTTAISNSINVFRSNLSIGTQIDSASRVYGFYCKSYMSNEEVDFIPVCKDGVGYFYDRTDDGRAADDPTRFHGNSASSGSLIIGPRKT